MTVRGFYTDSDGEIRPVSGKRRRRRVADDIYLYSTIRRGRTKVTSRKQHVLLHARNFPHTHIYQTPEGDLKRVRVPAGGKMATGYEVNPRLHSVLASKAHRGRVFVLDENIPRSVESELRRRGLSTFHVHDLFRRGTPDKVLSEYAERHNAIVVTRDVLSFPEPKRGDRIVVVDVPREDSPAEVVTRLKELGWL